MRYLIALILLAGACSAPAQLLAPLGECKLTSGEVIQDCKIGYRTFGKLNSTASNAILWPTYFTGTSENLQSYVGKGKLLDPEKYFVILVDALGDGISSSPSNSTKQPGMKFPKFTIHDMVNAEYRLVTEVLHIKKLHAVMGISMGGMQTFDWVVSYPAAVELAIPIVGSPALSAIDKLLWTAEMHALERDPAWAGGSYKGHPDLKTVLDIHNFALTTPEFRSKDAASADFDAWLAKSEKTAFDWNNWYRQLQAMLSQNLPLKAPAGPKLLVIAAAQDHMVNPLSAIAFAKASNGLILTLEGNCGHLAPGCESAKWFPVAQQFLSK